MAELSYGDADSENLLIQGDNLDALKALLPYYAGRVKCIAIDPPYRSSQVRNARSSADTSSGRKTPNWRRIRSFETVATALLRKEGCNNPASRQNPSPDSPGRNVPRSELTATTIRSSDAYGGWATTAGRTLAADWSENGKGSSTTAPRL